MRRHALLVIALSVPSLTPAFAQQELVPIATWSFNRCSQDLSDGHVLDGAGRTDPIEGKPNHLTANGASCAGLVGREGRFGDAGWFTGSAPAESRVATPLGDRFTLSAWVHPEPVAGSLGVVAGGGGSYALAYDRTLNGGRGGFRFAYSGSSLDSGPAPLGDWHHVAATVGPDPACAGELRLRVYVDAAPDASPPACAAVGDIEETAVVGAGFRGRIDEVSLYATSMGAAQVADLFGRPKPVYLGADTSAHPELGQYPTNAQGTRNPLGYDFYLGRIAVGTYSCDIITRAGRDIFTGDFVPSGNECPAFEMYAAAVARPQRTYGYVLLLGPNARPPSVPDDRAFGAAQADALAAQRERYRHVVYGMTLFADIEDLANSGWDSACGSSCTRNRAVLEGFLQRAIASGFTAGVYTNLEIWTNAFGAGYVPPANFVAYITSWNTSDDGSGLPAGGKNVDVESLREFERNTLDGMQGVLWQYTLAPADYDATRQDPTLRFVPRTRSAVDTALVIDSSGSMTITDPLRKRVAAGKTYVGASVDNDFIGVVDFDSVATLLTGPLPVRDNRSQLGAFIDQIDSAGGTNIGAGLGLACSALSAATTTNNTVRAAILLTDGQGAFSGEDQCFREKGWPVYTFGLGSLSQGAQDLLRGIAERTNGRFSLITPASSLCEFQRVRSEISGEPTVPCTTLRVEPRQTVPFTLAVPELQARATFSTSWAGSDVVLSLVTPSGRVIDRTTSAPDVYHLAGESFEVYGVSNPEAGTWELSLYGADVPAGGEDVTFVWTTVPSEGGPGGPSDIPSLVREVEQACAGGEIAPRGVCRSLEAKLRAAQASLERGQSKTAANQLRAFISELQAQRGKHVSEAAYLRLKAGAEAVLATLG